MKKSIIKKRFKIKKKKKKSVANKTLNKREKRDKCKEGI